MAKEEKKTPGKEEIKDPYKIMKELLSKAGAPKTEEKAAKK